MTNEITFVQINTFDYFLYNLRTCVTVIVLRTFLFLKNLE